MEHARSIDRSTVSRANKQKKPPNEKLAGDTAVALLKAGASTDKKDVDGCLALDLAPDKAVRKYIEQVAENEGIEIGTSS